MIPPVDEKPDRWGSRRARIIAGALGLVFVVIVARAGQVALTGEQGATTSRDTGIAARRADIVDRKGELLATSVPAWSLAADPRAIWDPKEVAADLAKALPGIDVKDLEKRLSDRDRKFVWVQRGLTPRQRDQVFALGLEGLRFEEESRRIYPGGRLAGHFLGFTDVDGKGVEGVEHAFDARLVKGGAPLMLTLDAGVQHALDEEIEGALRDFEFKGAAGVVVDARTGAVRAIASWPFLDPNKPNAASNEARLNRAISADYELGSIFKPLTVATALEAGVLGLSDTFDVSKPIRIGAALVRDQHMLDHPQAVTAAEIIAYSSNIGTVEIARRIGVRAQKEFLGKVGLLTRPDFEGPTAAAPLTPGEWDQLTAATVAYGHGIAVTPLAMAMSYTPFATGGDYLKPVFVEPVDPAEVERTRVMAAPTAEIVTEMMRGCVVVGTCKLAEAPGYQVAGKTGTAEKPGPDGYDPNRNITSFAAVFPASRPQFVVLVVLDEAQPRTGDVRTASVTAAAIAGRVIARAAPLLDVEPVLDQRAPRVDNRPSVRPDTRVSAELKSL